MITRLLVAVPVIVFAATLSTGGGKPSRSFDFRRAAPRR